MEFDDELLEIAVKRRSALERLAEDPHHRSELEEELDLSKTTCHRIIQTFDENHLLRRTDQGYGLTEFGRVLYRQVSSFDETIRAAYELRPILDAFESAEVDFELGLFLDAEVIKPQPDDPTPPLQRYLEMFWDAETILTVDRTSFSPPLYIEEILERSLEDDRTGIAIYPKSVVERRYSEFPDPHRKAAEKGIPVYRIGDPVPFGMTIYDNEHVALRSYDDKTGALELFAHTDDPEAISWAEEVFEHYYERSTLPSGFEDFPDWIPESDGYNDILVD